MSAGNVLTGSLAWYFATTQKTITTPLTFNRPFASDSKSVDATGLTQFAASFIYWRLNVTPENIEHNQKMILGFVPSAERDVLKKALDIETERIQKAGITTQFDTKEIRVMDDGSVQYSGVLKSSTTNGAIITPLKDQEKTYRLKLSYDNGVINLHNFEELKAKAKKITVSVGDRCDRQVLGACIQKSQVYCVFDGKLARIIQEQGRRDQLGVKFGSGDSPNCRGITVPELQSIDFDKINFSDFYEDLMKNQKIPDNRCGSTAKRAACQVRTVPAWCLKIARTQKSVSPM